MDGISEVISKMSFGNKIGFEFKNKIDVFKPMYGSFIIELAEDVKENKLEILGETKKEEEITIGNVKLQIDELIKLWKEPLEKVFPTKVKGTVKPCENILSDKKCQIVASTKFAKPRIFIPVFPGTNCEYDLSKAFSDAGGVPNVEIFRNLKKHDIEYSIDAFAKQIKEAQIIMIPGGFSAGDEPDGSGKFIASVFRNPRLKELVEKHLYERDGLILGICNGFQALVKLRIITLWKNNRYDRRHANTYI